MDVRTNRTIRAAWLIGLPALFFIAPAARAEFFLQRWQNQHQEKGRIVLSPEIRYFSSDRNFDQLGQLFLPSQGLHSFSRTQFDLTASWGAIGALTLYTRLSWAAVGVVDQTESYSTMGPSDQSVGANYSVASIGDGGSVDLQIQADLPLYDVEQSIADRTPFLGDGSMDLTAGAFVFFPLAGSGRDARLALDGGLGLTYRTMEFSMAIPWSAGLRFQAAPDRGLFAELGGRGIFSLRTDPTVLSKGCTRDPSTGEKSTAGSCFNFAVNPTTTVVRGRVGYRFSDTIAAHVESDMPVMGFSSPQGLQLVAGAQIRFGTGESGPKVRTPELSNSNQGFVSYAFQASVSGVNDRLNLVKIDKGSQQGVVKGQVFDIFSLSKDGSIQETVARATVTDVKPDEAVLKVTEYFREVWIEEGFIVKRPLK